MVFSLPLHKYNIIHYYTMTLFRLNIRLPFGRWALSGSACKKQAASTLFDRLRDEILYRKNQCSESTTTNRLTAVNSFEHFFQEAGNIARPVTLSSLTSDHIRAYERWAIVKGHRSNYVRCNLRNLRALINHIQPGLGTRLFQGIRTSNTQTDRRSVSEQVIRSLAQLKSDGNPKREQARNIFLFCLFMMGMPLIDAAFLKKSQLADGYITYERHKTHRQVRVCIHPALQALINRLQAPAGSPYLLPILTARDFASANRQYRRYLHTYNRQLARLSEYLGLDRHLTSYTPRHTWASLAFAYGVSTNTISQALCHANPHTTRAYIRDLSNTHLDQANQLVLSRLFSEMSIS